MNTNATESKSRSLLNRWDWAFFVATVLITAWTILLMQNQYIFGYLNLSDDGGNLFFFFFLLSLGSIFAVFIPPLWAVLRLHFRRPGWINGGAFLICSCLPLATVLALVVAWDFGQYRRGFDAWIIRNVDLVPIRSWLATQTPSDDIIQVPSADWPPVIQQLKPVRVDLWRSQGVSLLWGQNIPSRDIHTRRHVFIGVGADSPPPSEVLCGDDVWREWPFNYWRSAQPGVWWYMAGRSHDP